jgi:heme A synthase
VTTKHRRRLRKSARAVLGVVTVEVVAALVFGTWVAWRRADFAAGTVATLGAAWGVALDRAPLALKAVQETPSVSPEATAVIGVGYALGVLVARVRYGGVLSDF